MRAAAINVYLINYSDSTSDYGIISKMDEELSDAASLDSSYYWVGNTSTTISKSEQKISFEDIAAGTHSFDIKYVKTSGAANNANFRFRIEIVLAVQYAATIYYEYRIDDVQEDHDIKIYCLPASKYNVTVDCGPGGTIVPAAGTYQVTNGNYFNVKIYPDTNYSLSYTTLNSAKDDYEEIDDYFQYNIPAVLNDANIYVCFTRNQDMLYVKRNDQWTEVIQAYKKIGGE